jgi:hypothetical protein
MAKAVAKVAGVTIMPPGQNKGFNAHFKPVGRRSLDRVEPHRRGSGLLTQDRDRGVLNRRVGEDGDVRDARQGHQGDVGVAHEWLAAFGSLLAQATSRTVEQALRGVPTREVRDWCAKHLGKTVFARRREDFAAATKAQQKSTEPCT